MQTTQISNMIARRAPAAGTQQGVVLLEALFAILLITIALIGIMGLQATMMKVNDDSRSRAIATQEVQTRLGELWSSSSASVVTLLNNSPENLSVLPNGKLYTERGCGTGDTTCYTVRAEWNEQGGDVHNVTTITNVTPCDPTTGTC